MWVTRRIREIALSLSVCLLAASVGCQSTEPASSDSTDISSSSYSSMSSIPSTSSEVIAETTTVSSVDATTATSQSTTSSHTTSSNKPTSSNSPTQSTAPSSTTPEKPPIKTAAAILAQMTLEEKVGQVFMPRCPAKNGANSIRQYAPAGYVLYARDFDGKTAAQVRQTLSSYQQASTIPLLLSTDEEGGRVVRVSRNPALRNTPFLSPQDVYKAGGFEEVVRDTREKSKLLLSLGVNVNLAPVCDISTNASDYIYPRSFGQSAENTAVYIAKVVSTMEAEGISGTLKHFPGYGNNIDTHGDIANDNRPYSQFAEQDFLPFIAGIEQGVPSILVSHNIVACMDPLGPASLSKEVHRILRDTLHFEGVIMTDDLSMGAIKKYTGGRSPAVAAILADNDLLLTSDWETDYAALLDAVKTGEVPVSRIDDAVTRILNWKLRKGIIPAA